MAEAWWHRAVSGLGTALVRMSNPTRQQLKDNSGWLVDLTVGAGTLSPDAAMRVGAVIKCVTLRANVLASLPCFVMQKQRDGSRRRAQWMNAYSILRYAPNPRMTPTAFWRAMWHNYDARGNAYAEIQREDPGDDTSLPVYLWPIPADMVEVRQAPERDWRRNPGRVDYYLRTVERRIPAQNMVHIKGFCYDGLLGVSRITQAARAFAMASNVEQYGDQFFRNGGLPSGVVELPGEFRSEEAANKFRDSWTKGYGTLSNSQRVAILEGGAKFSAITVSPRDAQFLEARQWTATDIAGLYHIPARLVGVTDGPVGWGSVEQQTLEWLMFGLQPDIIAAEQELHTKLLGSSETYQPEFNLDGLLRSDIKTRMEANAIAWEHGALTADEWRARENMGPTADGQGSRRFVPLNYVPADRVDDAVDSRSAPPTPTTPRR